MSNQEKFRFEIDNSLKQIRVERFFAAPLALVWDSWTKPEILDEWWAPRPYHCITKSLDFREGGRWLYHMAGPEGDIHWCLFDYEKIEPHRLITGTDAFCDAEGNPNTSKPKVEWQIRFEESEGGTRATILLTFASLTDLETLIKMGFREGFTAGLDNLDRYTRAHLALAEKAQGTARASTYLNFAGNTEEAFQFYRSVFRTEYIGKIHRFGDMPPQEGAPPLPDSIKNLVLNVALPILGGHVLMGTDSVPEMGFSVKQGNNVHINLEPDSREEAERLFRELSAGGEVQMPLQDMFWGAYYGSLRDKFGVHWMVNYSAR